MLCKFQQNNAYDYVRGIIPEAQRASGDVTFSDFPIVGHDVQSPTGLVLSQRFDGEFWNNKG